MRRPAALGPDGRYSWITPHLLCGGYPLLEDLPALRDAGVGAILSLREDDAGVAPRYAALGLRYRCLPLRDDAGPSPAHLARCCAFIEEMRAANLPVLVHCALGVGRGATVSAAYLIYTGISLSAALTQVRAGRPCISPSAQQLVALARFAQETKMARTRSGA